MTGWQASPPKIKKNGHWMTGWQASPPKIKKNGHWMKIRVSYIPMKRGFFLFLKEKHMKEIKTVVLTKDFYERHKDHKEILSNKDGRPYLTLVIEHKDKMFAIPFRTNLKHKFAFYFYSSERKKEDGKGRPGIDYTKAVIIQESDVERNSAIDKKEWLELKKNINTIIREFEEYVKAFKHSLENGDFGVRPVFKFSALQYFIQEIKDF